MDVVVLAVAAIALVLVILMLALESANVRKPLWTDTLPQWKDTVPMKQPRDRRGRFMRKGSPYGR